MSFLKRPTPSAAIGGRLDSSPILVREDPKHIRRQNVLYCGPVALGDGTENKRTLTPDWDLSHDYHWVSCWEKEH